ncbi:ribosome maturation factor RimM [Sphingomonas jatrophae]|uniref:Ribosome maturation factor RimM n=1 Tax=Sphingomonas jatrophae TaxID=1166337 RepID=A0A1I6JYD8_9SPHN|nr:ribosome maturation factor RimM [Sphingomonas jatrophae]SFR83976.1 16S rRNA processing protein RimM [Sphingomonas jatrophae]
MPPAPPGADAPAPPPRAPADGEVVLAVVTGAHGIGGEVKLKVFAEDLSAYAAFNGGTLTLKAVRPVNGGAVARFAEVRDRTAAEALRGTSLTVPRDMLPPLAEGEYYHADLIGRPAVSDAGEALGRVVAVEDFGAGDIVEIERADGGLFMVPVAKAVTIEAERVVVDAAFVP